MPGQARCRRQALRQKRSRSLCCASSHRCFRGRSSHYPRVYSQVVCCGADRLRKRTCCCEECRIDHCIIYNRSILSGVVSVSHELTPCLVLSGRRASPTIRMSTTPAPVCVYCARKLIKISTAPGFPAIALLFGSRILREPVKCSRFHADTCWQQPRLSGDVIGCPKPSVIRTPWSILP